MHPFPPCLVPRRRRPWPGVLLLLFAFLVVVPEGHAQDSCTLRLGTNLAGPSDYGSEWPWVDIMHDARTWLTHNATWIDGGQNDWDTGVLGQMECDADGYPLELPVAIPGTETEQVVRTVWANTHSLPAGVYTVTWQGQGRLDVWGDATLLTNEPGRLTFDMAPADGLIALEILQSQRGDHVRDIRVLLPGHADTPASDEWSPEWIAGLEPFVALRFMDWGHTNDSPLERWEDRPRVDDYTWTPNGVPYELWVEICNRLQKDAWVCVPHRADSTYVRNMATLFRDTLDPERTIYLEYSNEIWNWMFSQTHYCNDQGDQGVPWPERVAPFIQRVLDIWTEVFAGEEHRLVRVVGVQGSYQDVSNRIVGSLRPGSFDAFAPAAYFHFDGAGMAAIEQLGAAATAADVLHWARVAAEGESFGFLRTQKRSIGDRYGIPMLYYEGGQHLTPQPFGSDQPYGPALVAANLDPGMHDLYTTWIDSLATLGTEEEPGLFMNFSFIAPTSARYGSWGVLTDQWSIASADLQSAPKYQALLDRACDASTVGVAPPEEDGPPPVDRPARVALHPNAPNPFNPMTTVSFDLPRRAEIRLAVYDLKGRHLSTLIDGVVEPGRHRVAWRPTELASGTYFLRLVADGRSEVRKCALLR